MAFNNSIKYYLCHVYRILDLHGQNIKEVKQKLTGCSFTITKRKLLQRYTENNARVTDITVAQYLSKY